MKLIKLMLAGMVVMSFALAQDDTQGPDHFQQAFMTTMQNGGTPDEAFEAVAAVFHQMEVECDDCEMTEEEFQEGKAEAKAAFDAVLANGGTPEEAFHAAMEAGNDGPGTCDVCGYEYGGEDDHHGHCRVCDAEMNSDEDWNAHCDENPDHCKAQAGDVCGFRGWDGQGEECGYVHTGDPGEDHHHCDTCGMPVNSGDEMGAHCNENPDHCGGEDGDHEGEFYCGECDASFVSEGEMNEHMQREHGEGYSGPPTNHWDGNCAAICGGHGEYWLETDGEPDNGAEDGPYATWDHDADGNPVDCDCGDDGNHEDDGDHGGYDNLGGDTSWADAAYQIDGNQEHYDIVMSVPEEDREKVYEDIKRDVEEHRGDHDGDGENGGPPAFEDIDANGDGLVNMDEARAFFSNDPEFDEDEFAGDFDRVDQNDDGNVDMGEHVDEVVQQIAGEVFGGSMANGATPEDAFNNVVGALHEYIVGGGHNSQENFDNGRNAAWNAFQEALQNGASPEEAFGAAMGAAAAAGEDGDTNN